MLYRDYFAPLLYRRSMRPSNLQHQIIRPPKAWQAANFLLRFSHHVPSTMNRNLGAHINLSRTEYYRPSMLQDFLMLLSPNKIYNYRVCNNQILSDLL